MASRLPTPTSLLPDSQLPASCFLTTEGTEEFTEGTGAENQRPSNENKVKTDVDRCGLVSNLVSLHLVSLKTSLFINT